MPLSGRIFVSGYVSFLLTLPVLWSWIEVSALPIAALLVFMFVGGWIAMMTGLLMEVWP